MGGNEHTPGFWELLELMRLEEKLSKLHFPEFSQVHPCEKYLSETAPICT